MYRNHCWQLHSLIKQYQKCKIRLLPILAEVSISGIKIGKKFPVLVDFWVRPLWLEFSRAKFYMNFVCLVTPTSAHLADVPPAALAEPCDALPLAPPPCGSAGRGQPRSRERTGHAALASPVILAPAPGGNTGERNYNGVPVIIGNLFS